MTNLDIILKSSILKVYHFADKGLYSQNYDFSSNVWM